MGFCVPEDEMGGSICARISIGMETRARLDESGRRMEGRTPFQGGKLGEDRLTAAVEDTYGRRAGMVGYRIGYRICG